ncbi:NADPH-dependent FMN reductase [Phaeobacter sp. 22II1-1F12B]|uniref:NADPH-dependent FMN reductase n=1 Tax=Phaeobacter sp. 22II1-1F12B TaxID=1317111 RepID=UPI000B527649|nr:NAD(P)H-dependent oxidoreductase [Phaeobacter sp. 22II1-1F12B]OWU82107.1 NADPH-dependent FMN reductase [Phaeobacter sp. 22II1-1F12B]
MSTYKLVGLSGSLRRDSTNTRLLYEAARLFDAESFMLLNLNFPLYDGDREKMDGIPDVVRGAAANIAEADGILISTPEYNKGPSGVLKNALDWISRVKGKPFQGKPLAVMSASSGRAGGERSQLVLRTFMVPFQTRILQGPEMHLANSSNQFDKDGRLTGELYIETLQQLMDNLRAEVSR